MAQWPEYFTKSTQNYIESRNFNFSHFVISVVHLVFVVFLFFISLLMHSIYY